MKSNFQIIVFDLAPPPPKKNVMFSGNPIATGPTFFLSLLYFLGEWGTSEKIFCLYRIDIMNNFHAFPIGNKSEFFLTYLRPNKKMFFRPSSSSVVFFYIFVILLEAWLID